MTRLHQEARRLPIVDGLRRSAEAFRKHPIYDSEGDPALLIAQADECDAAATTIEELLEALEAVELARHTDAENDWLRATKLSDAAIAKVRGGEA